MNDLQISLFGYGNAIYWGGCPPPGAKARVDLGGFIGTTEVVPCYKTRAVGFEAKRLHSKRGPLFLQ